MSWSKEDANYEEWYERHPEFEPELPLCDNCQRPTEPEELTDLGFMACPACAEETRLIDEADQTCPVLYTQVMAATGVNVIRDLVKNHAALECPECKPTRMGAGS